MRNADILDRILAGEQVEAASQEVRELAQLAAVLQGAWGAGPTKAATSRTRAAVLTAFQVNGIGNGAVTVPVRVVPVSRGRRLVTRLALAAALVVGLPAMAWAASEDALPGQLLYPVKRGFEEVRLALAGDPVDEARVLLDIAGERVEETVLAASLGIEEAAQLAREGYEEVVARFEGRIVEAQALGLQVDELLAEATDLFASYQQVFEAIFGPPPSATPAPGPTEVMSAGVPPGQDQAAEKGNGAPKASKGGGGGHKRDGSKANSGDGDKTGGGDEGGSGGQVGGAGSGSNGSGSNGGGNTGGAGDDDEGKEDDDEGKEDDDEGKEDDHEGKEDDHEGDEDGDEEHGDGKGLGHVKAIGEGHHKDKGEGHTEDR